MRRRIIRPTLGKPVELAETGIKVNDLYIVLGATVSVFIVMVLLKIKIGNFPLALPCALLTLCSGVFIARYIYKKKRPFWVTHRLAYLLRKISGFGQNIVRPRNGRIEHNWLVDMEEHPRKDLSLFLLGINSKNKI